MMHATIDCLLVKQNCVKKVHVVNNIRLRACEAEVVKGIAR